MRSLKHIVLFCVLKRENTGSHDTDVFPVSICEEQTKEKT